MTDEEKFKLIERTAKHDAYQRVVFWARNQADAYGDALWFAKEKVEGHRVWLAEQPFRYTYTGGFVPTDGYYDKKEDE